MAGPQTTYTREEMDAILKRAIEREQAKSEGISREELIAAATEVGIGREEVEAAARELDAAKAQNAEVAQKRRESMGVVDEHRAHAIRRFWGLAVTYGAVTAFLFVLSMRQHADWWIWAAMGMGLSLALRASRTFFGDPREFGMSRRDRRRFRRHERGEFKAHIEEAVDARTGHRPAGPAGDAKTRVADPNVRVESRDDDAADGDDAGGDASTRTSRRS